MHVRYDQHEKDDNPWHAEFYCKKILNVFIQVGCFHKINMLKAALFHTPKIFYPLSCWIYLENINFRPFLNTEIMRTAEMQFILHSWYHGCWWPDGARSQCISRHHTDLVITEYIQYSTTEGLTCRVSKNIVKTKWNKTKMCFNMKLLYCPYGNSH